MKSYGRREEKIAYSQEPYSHLGVVMNQTEVGLESSTLTAL